MKHLKLFENKENEYWLVDYRYIYQNNSDCSLFPDEKSAEDYAIMLVNDEKRGIEGDNYSDDMFFVYYDEAIEWCETLSDIRINVSNIKLEPPFKNKELEKRREIKKYNL